MHLTICNNIPSKSNGIHILLKCLWKVPHNISYKAIKQILTNLRSLKSYKKKSLTKSQKITKKKIEINEVILHLIPQKYKGSKKTTMNDYIPTKWAI